MLEKIRWNSEPSRPTGIRCARLWLEREDNPAGIDLNPTLERLRKVRLCETGSVASRHRGRPGGAAQSPPRGRSLRCTPRDGAGVRCPSGSDTRPSAEGLLGGVRGRALPGETTSIAVLTRFCARPL